jgi:hypothetical protein
MSLCTIAAPRPRSARISGKSSLSNGQSFGYAIFKYSAKASRHCCILAAVLYGPSRITIANKNNIWWGHKPAFFTAFFVAFQPQ